jgi:hypothetical protein
MSRTVMGEFLTAASNRCRAVAQDVLQVIDASHPLRRDLRLDATTSDPANGFLAIAQLVAARATSVRIGSAAPIASFTATLWRSYGTGMNRLLWTCSGASNCPHGGTPKGSGVSRRQSAALQCPRRQRDKGSLASGPRNSFPRMHSGRSFLSLFSRLTGAKRRCVQGASGCTRAKRLYFYHHNKWL